MTKRVVFIHNPKSSLAQAVEDQVMRPLAFIFPDGNVHEHVISHDQFEDSVSAIENDLKHGDLVVAAGGDGTATITANAILNSNLDDITVGFLGFGNFNDISSSLMGKKDRSDVHKLIANYTKTIKVYPLEVIVNGEFFRYGVSYVTLGLVAGSVLEFEKSKKRQKLQEGKTNRLSSAMTLAPYYLKHKNKKKLPRYTSGGTIVENTTDYMAINGSHLVGFKIGENQCWTDCFKKVTLNTSKFLKTMPFTIKSIRSHMPGEFISSDTLKFDEPSTIEFQSDGEYRELENVRTITIKKSEKHLNVIHLI